MKHDLTFELRFLQYALPTVGDKRHECFAFLGIPCHSANQLLGCDVSCVGQNTQYARKHRLTFHVYGTILIPVLVFDIASCFVSFFIFS